jgi:hypothetical protein
MTLSTSTSVQGYWVDRFLSPIDALSMTSHHVIPVVSYRVITVNQWQVNLV